MTLSDHALLWAHFRRGWRGKGGSLVWLLVGSALVAAGHTVFTGMWKLVLDAVEAGGGAAEGAALVGIGAVQAVLYVYVQGTRTRMNAHIQRVTREDVWARVTAAAPGEVERLRTGDVVARLTDDLSDDKLGWFLCSGVFRAYEAGLVAVGCVLGLLWVDPPLALGCLAPMPVLVGIHLLLGPHIGRRASAVQAAVSRLSTVTQDALDGVRVLQARGLVPLARRAYGEAARAQADAEIRSLQVQQAMFLEFSHGWQLALVALLLVGSWRLEAGAIGPAELVVASGYVMTLVFQMYDFAAFVVRGKVAASALRRLEELLALSPDRPEARVGAEEGLSLSGDLDAGYLKLALGEGFSLRPGELVAVAGPVGAGKSTLLRALAGEVGAIVAPRSAWVPQDPVVLSLTVGENVSLGRPVNVGAAAGLAQLSPDLARMPAGLDTAVGEKGVTLSGGQQQRVQLARALADDARLWLFDDATSALDADTEGRFWDALPRADRMVVVVTHRPATLARADRVVYLREGRIVAVGTHAELCARVASYGRAYG